MSFFKRFFRSSSPSTVSSQRDRVTASNSTNAAPRESSLSATTDTASIYGGVASRALPVPETSTATTQWSSSVQTLLDQPPATLPFRLIVGGMIFSVAFGAWAWFGQIEDVGKAQGQLVPQGKTYKVHPIEAGKVTAVAVKEGETVRQGQVLAELDTELAQKEVDRLQQLLSAYQTELGQKQSLLEQMGLSAQTRTAIASADLGAQRSAIAQAREKAATTRRLLAQLGTESTAYQERRTRLKPLTSTLQERLQQLRTEEAAHQQRLERLKTLGKEGAISQEYIFQAEQALRDTQQRITQSQLQEETSTNEQLFQAEQSLRDRTSAITTSEGELASALEEVERSQSEFARKQAEGRNIKNEAEEQIQQLKVEITQLEAKIAETKNLLVSAQAKLQQRFLYAPVDGVVLSLNLQNTGEVVQPGQTLAEIAPQKVPLVLSAVLPNQEAGFVEKGMSVQVKFDAYPYQDYGIIPGKVVSISSDAKADERLGAVYRVEVALDRNYVTAQQEKIFFKAGQTATADIIIRRRRIADVLFDPLKQLQKGGINL
ncbi:MAG: HlyD family efflux transporter periplasmic adaptor subunit [Kastovskya adunca ATA6-11-RM4]|nr:HlyD family efflux transporter periplasmic adaptor subunit [Kastovskya adunca ATA6-11-RM4]